MSLTGGSKATFTSIDDGLTFEVQYNPKEFSVAKGLTWTDSKEQGDDKNSVQFQKGAPMTASFDLYFDTTNSNPPGNVVEQWVSPLLALTKAEIQPADGEAAELDKQRPRAFNFTWGSFELQCVIEQISVTYLMFAADGTAVRARASVKLKEWKPPSLGGGGGGGAWGTDKLSLVQVKGGQTVTQVAASNNVDWRRLAEDNGITDPLEDLTGAVLTIRT